MLGIDTDLQTSLQTRDVMYESEKGGQSLLESSEPAGRALTKPRRSSAEKPEPFLLLEQLGKDEGQEKKEKYNKKSKEINLQ